MGGRRLRRERSPRPPVAPSRRNAEGSEDTGRRPHRADAPRASSPARHLEAALASIGTSWIRDLHGRRQASAERNLRRALEKAKEKAKIDVGEERLSWHSLRHSYASMLATDLELPATTLARLTGHADAGFTLRVYARDARDETTVVDDVLARAAESGIGG